VVLCFCFGFGPQVHFFKGGRLQTQHPFGIPAMGSVGPGCSPNCKCILCNGAQ